ncbi:L,D-transpeptidase family protein [Flavobacterium weaverense]|uniref:Murein L,D-transpeptidase YcbB/YkuD n=1 Tax=Flavobacterium weaverense TaxID=271156 RepID=A0A3L9ZWM2_9FLAO|nr:L,D-transpeptidase family protein [Flavobacterium weaverense]RMA76820.1 murein L,D-transpeptidase YcbB/YkuD [Flavobacterium weaverense]
MKNFTLSILLLLFSFSNAHAYQTKSKTAASKTTVATKIPSSRNTVKIDNVIIYKFLTQYPKLKTYRNDLLSLYKNRSYTSIWLKGGRVIEFADLLYSKTTELEQEGLNSKFAYKDKVDNIFSQQLKKIPATTNNELLLSSMYIFYAKKVYKGIDSDKIKEIGWFLPQKNLSYSSLLTTLLDDPQALNKDEKLLFDQYYKLRDVLQKYREIERNGTWNFIKRDSLIREYKPGDTAKTIGQIRQRLAVTGDLLQDSKSDVYDEELIKGVLNYKKRNGYNQDPVVNFSQINRMNVPIAQYIKTILVNMERCRWIAPELTKAPEYIIVNIPSYKLFYKRDGITELESNVFVGGTMNETVIFSGDIKYLVFSPYWNIPTSIVQSEIKTAMQTDKNYLSSNDMEWNNGNVRQKPGPKNPLGKVKFIFPNSNDIYLHGTPSKDLFDSEYRAYSHGCINVNKSEELAFLILKNDPDWPAERIRSAMDGGKETTCFLKNKLPVHMGYFTSWVNDAGEVSFFHDIYERDDRLAELLYSDEVK